MSFKTLGELQILMHGVFVMLLPRFDIMELVLVLADVLYYRNLQIWCIISTILEILASNLHITYRVLQNPTQYTYQHSTIFKALIYGLYGRLMF